MTTAVQAPAADTAPPTQTPLATRRWLTSATAAASVTLLVLLAAIGGYLRRWISDDGLIVLRTVRNLLAGNGPVFNAGERVEANTSTLWQYLIYIGALVTDAPLETIALWLALGFTVLGVLAAGIGTGWLYARRAGIIIIPFGGLVYLALPPARDFATSGLEWGLSIFWIAIQWLLLVAWVRLDPRLTTGRSAGRHRDPSSASLDWVTYALAFWSGLSWLVRPELALYGGLTGILLLLTARRLWAGLAIVLVAVPLPGAYQIFRMGYYGLITPHTAVAKSASGAEWTAGGTYLLDLLQPYFLILAFVVVLVAAAALLWRQSAGEVGVDKRSLSWRAGLRSAPGIVGLIVGAALLHVLYVLRVGGDFMHGRMWLLPLFALLLPVFIIPAVDFVQRSTLIDAVLLAAGVIVAVWAVVVMQRGTDHVEWAKFEAGDLGIVDEREFWTFATEREPGDPPRYAEDFLPALTLGDWRDSLTEGRAMKAAALAPMMISDEPPAYSWRPINRIPTETDLSGIPLSVYHVNLGMTSMNAPLDVRVLDSVGLTTPLAARQPRDPDGRVGHDKHLPRSWQMADTAADIGDLPPWLDTEETMAARAALRTPELAELIASYRAPLDRERFFANLRFALGAGRSLEVPEDPRELLDDKTLALLESAAAEGAYSNPSVPGVADDVRISWPVEVRTDEVAR